MHHVYQISDSGQQLRVEIDCKIVALENYVGVDVLEVVPGLYLGFDGYTEAQKEWLSYGLEVVGNDFLEKTEQFDSVVQVTALHVTPENIPNEALAPALAGWMAAAYGVEYEPPTVTFDMEQGQFVFAFAS
ncbi:MAG: hypothetical protein AAF653_15100 [Chloroflexota bacterium]